MKTLFVLLVAILAAISMLEKTGENKRYAFATAYTSILPNFSGFLKNLTWNSAVNYLKAKWGSIVVDGRGKIGGHVASKNRGGSYFRTKVTPSNPQSTGQITARNRFSALSQAWRSLTNSQRLAWNAAVGDYARTNVFGDLVNPSGFNLFQRLNNNLVRIGEASLTLPPLPEAVTDIVIGALSAAAGAGTISLAYTAGGDANSEIEVWATPPMSPGKSYVKNEYRLVDQFTADTASPLDMAAAYVAKFGAITSAAGQVIHVKTVAVSVNTGQVAVAQSTYAVIAA
jgi:hypothetical protein